MSAFALLLAFAAQPQSPPAAQSRSAQPGETSFSFRVPVPTARQLYVGCSLLAAEERLREPLKSGPDGDLASAYAPETCGLLAAAYLDPPPPPPNTPVSPGFRLCVPADPAGGRARLAAIARTYAAYFERNAASVADLPGDRVLREALRERWGC